MGTEHASSKPFLKWQKEYDCRPGRMVWLRHHEDYHQFGDTHVITTARPDSQAEFPTRQPKRIEPALYVAAFGVSFLVVFLASQLLSHIIRQSQVIPPSVVQTPDVER